MTKEPAIILVYGAAADDRRVVFMREGEHYLNYRIKLIDRNETQLTIGELLTSPQTSPVETDADAPGLLLFAGMPEDTMQQFLGALRDNQIRFDLKAVVTETNRAWTLASLLEELHEEHALMRAWHELAQLTHKADLLLMEPAVLLDTGGFEEAVETTKRFLKQQSGEAMTVDILIEKKNILAAHLSRLGY